MIVRHLGSFSLNSEQRHSPADDEPIPARRDGPRIDRRVATDGETPRLALLDEAEGQAVNPSVHEKRIAARPDRVGETVGRAGGLSFGTRLGPGGGFSVRATPLARGRAGVLLGCASLHSGIVVGGSVVRHLIRHLNPGHSFRTRRIAEGLRRTRRGLDRTDIGGVERLERNLTVRERLPQRTVHRWLSDAFAPKRAARA